MSLGQLLGSISSICIWAPCGFWSFCIYKMAMRNCQGIALSSQARSVVLIDQSLGVCSINQPCLTEIGVHVFCGATPEHQHSLFLEPTIINGNNLWCVNHKVIKKEQVKIIKQNQKASWPLVWDMIIEKHHRDQYRNKSNLTLCLMKEKEKKWYQWALNSV